jgi:hypothetical protein
LRVADRRTILFEYPQQRIVWAAAAVDTTARVLERLDAAAREENKK